MAPFRPDMRPGGRSESAMDVLGLWGACPVGGAEEVCAITGALL